MIHIALEERVHPRKGLELLIAQHGICRAITYFEQFPNLEDREECLKLLVRTLHAELVANLKSAIERRENSAPATTGIPELIRDRDWLFGELDAYVDTSHVANVIRLAPDLEDRDAIRLALELCDYGAQLSPRFRLRGEPPFIDIYRDHAIYLRALLAVDLDAAIEYFKAKIAAHDDPMLRARCAQVLVGLLLRHQRYGEAVEISLEHLRDVPANQLAGPTLFHALPARGRLQTSEGIGSRAGRLSHLRRRRNPELTVTSRLNNG